MKLINKNKLKMTPLGFFKIIIIDKFFCRYDFIDKLHTIYKY